MKYKSVAVIYGSDSSEWEVACRSGEFTASRLDEEYDVYEILARFGSWKLVAMRKSHAMRVPFPEGSRPEVDKTDFSLNVLGEKVNFDFVYIMQHGFPGETGQLQGYFEMLGIPFSSCSSFVCNVAFDKYAAKSYIRGLKEVKMAPDLLVHQADSEEEYIPFLKSLKLPVFVKPNRGGSSFGITRVTDYADILPAIKFAFSEGDSVILEEGISGRELTCAGYIDGSEIKTLPVLENISDNDFFDYDAKYNGHCKEICPAEISKELSDKVQEATRAIYHRLGCSGLVRIDYIAAEDGLYFLEVNIIPGMTSASIVPKMVKAAGMDMTDFLNIVIESR